MNGRHQLSRLITRLALAVLALSCATQRADAADTTARLRFGVFAHFANASHNADFNELPGFPKAQAIFSDGSGSGFAFGGALSAPFALWNTQSALLSRFSIELRAGIHTYDGALEAREPTTVIINGTPTSGIISHTIDANFSDIAIEPLLSVRLFDEFKLLAGLGLHFSQSSEFEQREILAQPQGAEFISGGTEEAPSAGNIPEALGMRSALQLGVAYEFGIGAKKPFRITPEFIQTIPLSDVADGVDWSFATTRFGIALLYAGTPPKKRRSDTTIIRDTVEKRIKGLDQVRVTLIETTAATEAVETDEAILSRTTVRELYERESPAPLPTLTVNVEAVVIDTANNEAPLEQTRIVQRVTNKHIPLLTYIFFDENSAQIPLRYHLLNSRETPGFTLRESDVREPLNVYYTVLNIIGQRLRAYPQTRVTITGCNANVGAESGARNLSRARADIIRRYFTDVWKIDSGRVTIRARNLPARPSNNQKPEGREENRRVELTFDNNEMISPALKSDTSYHSSVRAIRFKPQIVSDVGVAEWELMLLQNGEFIDRVQGNGRPPEAIDWKLLEKLGATVDPAEISYALRVRDTDGQTSQTEFKEINIETMVVIGADDPDFPKASERYSLLLFDFDRSGLSSDNKRTLEFIKSRLGEGAQVSVIGQTDRVGDEDYNRRLSERRATSVARALRIEGASVSGSGESAVEFPNDVPEGRFYSRTVNIIIEYPAAEK